jgi:hypothetical protein
MSDEEVWAYVSRRLNQGPLDAVPLLEGLSREDAKRFVASGTTLRCRAGEAVIQAGSSGHEMFVLLSGHVDGCGPNDPLKLLAQLGPGELFGEIAYLSEVRRSASVVARTDVEVLLLTQSYLQRVMAEAPAVAARVLFNLSLILCRRLAGAAGPNGARSVGYTIDLLPLCCGATALKPCPHRPGVRLVRFHLFASRNPMRPPTARCYQCSLAPLSEPRGTPLHG